MPKLIQIRYLPSIIIFMIIGVLLYLSVLLYFGWSQSIYAIKQIDFSALCLYALLACSAFLWRFLRWHKILIALNYHVPKSYNFKVYLSGLALTTSPGKIGETLRSLFLLPYGVTIHHSLAAFLTDRFTDVLGVILLGILAVLCNNTLPTLLLMLFIGLITLSVLGKLSLSHVFLVWLEKKYTWIPLQKIFLIFRGWSSLWTLKRSINYTLIASIAYGSQALAFYCISTHFNVNINIFEAIHIFVNATLFGAASMIPGAWRNGSLYNLSVNKYWGRKY